MVGASAQAKDASAITTQDSNTPFLRPNRSPTMPATSEPTSMPSNAMLKIGAICSRTMPKPLRIPGAA